MSNKKNIGSYYTPKIIADFLVDYLSDKLKDKSDITILEPSAGDGNFIDAIFNHEILSKKVKKVIAVEKEKEEIQKIIQRIKDKRIKTFNSDFLEFQNKYKQKFALCIGNPPYIKRTLLEDKQGQRCIEIHKKSGLSANKPNNIWTAFLVRCIRYVNEDGILAFVLPAEISQVKYAEELRDLIIEKFERVEIFTFKELLFKDVNAKGQDTLVLIAEKKSKTKGVFYTNINKQSDLLTKNFSLVQSAIVKGNKWTYFHLTSDEIELVTKMQRELKTVDSFCVSIPGIVTAANDFFIVDYSIVKRFFLQKFVQPIIQKGIFVNGSVILSKKDFNDLTCDAYPTFLLVLDNLPSKKMSNALLEYLAIGKQAKLHKRYKMTIRNKWYEVPNIGIPSQGLFFKRCDEYPKLIINKAQVLATDSAYKISMKEGYKINSLIYSFYNSLTLSIAELNGRSYGGGVLEITPNEFKKLPVPYLSISNNSFSSYVKEFKNKSSIKEICKRNDKRILKSIDKKIDDDSIKKLGIIREKLYHRRIKTD